jgi:hypothetical protein
MTVAQPDRDECGLEPEAELVFSTAFTERLAQLGPGPRSAPSETLTTTP